jgi:glycosyltransferase involved in cell wall biosynthesis
VLQYTYGGKFISGIDTYLLEAYRAIDRDKVQFDFLFRYENPFRGLPKELELLGARVYELNISEREHVLLRQLRETRRLWRFFRRHQYPIVEINMTSLFMILQAAAIARVFGSRVRIVHSHAATTSEPRVKRILKAAFTPLLDLVGTEFWSCSSEGTAQYLFTRRTLATGSYSVVRNGIDTTRFSFDTASRERLRYDLGLGDALCVAQIGRLVPEKNPRFTLRVFRDLLRLRPDARLLMVGDGVEFDALRHLATRLNLDAYVTFTGARMDVAEIMQAVDVVIAPSFSEGFPVACLESQAAGLPCLVSDAFPREVDVTGFVTFMSLHASTSEWAATAAQLRNDDRASGAERVRAAGFDRRTTADELLVRYLDLLGRKSGKT